MSANLESDLPGIAPGIRRSMEAYWRDLPRLLPLRSQKHQWVAYHGDERVDFGPSRAELYQECFRRGYNDDEVYIGRLEPHYQPPWEPIEVECFTEGSEEFDVETPPEQAS